MEGFFLNNTERSTQTKNNILNAATVSFAEYGYDGTGVAEICLQAGVSKGAFYYHFESKESVFLNLIDGWLQNLETILNEESKQAVSVPEALLAMSAKIQSLINNNPIIMNLFLELWTHAARNPRVRRATTAPYERYRLIFKNIIQRGIDEGSFAAVDTTIASQLLLSLTSGLFLQASLDPKEADWGKILHDIIIMLLDGLKRRD